MEIETPGRSRSAPIEFGRRLTRWNQIGYCAVLPAFSGDDWSLELD